MTKTNKKNLLNHYNSIREDNAIATFKCEFEKGLIDAFGNQKCSKECYFPKQNGNIAAKLGKNNLTDYNTEYEESLRRRDASEDALRAIKELLDILGFYLILDDDGFAIDIIEKEEDA